MKLCSGWKVKGLLFVEWCLVRCDYLTSDVKCFIAISRIYCERMEMNVSRLRLVCREVV